jgi:hypothetical protein
VKRAQAAAISAVGAPLIAALGASLTWKTEGLEHLHFAGNGRRPIMAFWHGRVLAATYYFRRRGIVVMISENFDGEWIARIIEQFGFRTSRGSSSRGGQRALLKLKREMEQGRASGFAVDGPRGPARHAQPGAIWLAKLTGNPIVPFHMEASSYWNLKSWDRTQIPRPFSTVALTVGDSIEVPADADDAALEMKRVELEQSLFALERRAAVLVAHPKSLVPSP